MDIKFAIYVDTLINEMKNVEIYLTASGQFFRIDTLVPSSNNSGTRCGNATSKVFSFKTVSFSIEGPKMNFLIYHNTTSI